MVVELVSLYECDTHAILKLNQLDPRRHTQFRLLKSALPQTTAARETTDASHCDAVHAWWHANGEAGRGGASRDRTGDLLVANQALSQLSYSPESSLEDGGPKWI